MKYFPGVKTLDISAAEKYAVRESYERFDQKNNMIYRGDWDDSKKELSTLEYVKRRHERVSRNDKGFSNVDWAFLQASLANSNAAGFLINVPNKNGTSWNSRDIKAWSADVAKPEINPNQNDAKKNAEIIRKAGLYFGADQVGFCILDRRWVYSHYYDSNKKASFPIKFSDEEGYEKYTKPQQLQDGTQVIPKEMKYVIVFIHEMDYLGMKTAPRLNAMAITMSVYSKIAFTTMSIAEFIRGLGYNAIPSANCTAMNIPLAIDAGLGELGRNGKLINPLYGPRCRISKVITDLPLIPDKPIDFGVAKFCSKCTKCADSCAAKAIPYGEPSYNPQGNYSHKDVLQWQVNHEKCRRFWNKMGTNCGICINVCPYNKPVNMLSICEKSIIAMFPFLSKAFIKINNALSSGKPMASEQFWNKKM